MLQPNWSSQAQFAGYYIAQEKGFYKDEGIDLRIVHPFPSQGIEERIHNKEIDAFVLPLAQAMELRSQGIPLVNILQTSMNSAIMLISRLGGNPLEMKGAKTIMWRGGFGQIPYCFSAKEGLDYKWIEASTSTNIFVSGAVDITLAMSYNEYYQILQTGIITPDKGIFRFSENGYNIQEDGVWVKKETYDRDPEAAQKFARASRKGWEWAVANPEEALDIVMAYVKKYRIPTNRVLQKLMLEEILRLQVNKDSGRRDFSLRPDMVGKASSILKEGGLIDRDVTYEELLP